VWVGAGTFRGIVFYLKSLRFWRFGWTWGWAEAVALSAMPTSQKRDMGHPLLWKVSQMWAPPPHPEHDDETVMIGAPLVSAS
jgi:hypothetical protein